LIASVSYISFAPLFFSFSIPSLYAGDLKKAFSKYGKIEFLFLKNDKFNNNNYFFGGVNFISIDDKQSFIAFCKSINITAIEKEDRSNIKKVEQQRSQTQTNTFQNPSLHYYHKAYGKDIEEFQLTHNYQELFDIKSASNDEKFQLTTLYPGLLVGSGYNHPKLKDNHDFQLGFFFDHTTGLPIISGSSIKGVVRSLFTDEKFEYLKSVYDVKETKEVLEKRLFLDGSTIFYDAYIIATHKENKGKIFASDYITSHHSDDPMGQFKEPNPVKFLKVLSGVTFQFQFKGRKEDIALIQAIILDFGVGAKTNVGYGQFEE